MQGMTHVELAGTITHEPELRYTPAGLAILTVDLAGEDRVNRPDGEKRLPWYHRATLFGAFAEAIVNSMHAGDAAYLVGRLAWSEWTEAQGHRRTAVRINVDTLKLLEQPAEDRVRTDARDQVRLKEATNRAVVMGNLTRDVELRYTQAGDAVANLSVAVNERVGRDQAERVGFYGAVAWRDLAELAAPLTKGSPVVIAGRLVNDSWTDRDGSQRYDTKIEAHTLECVARPPSATKARAATPPPPSVDDQFPPEEDLPF